MTILLKFLFIVIGDLVVDPEKSKVIESLDAADEFVPDQVDGNADDNDVDDEEEIVQPLMEKMEEQKEKKESKHRNRGNEAIEEILVEVTEENISKYTLKDVILPLVGFKVRFPKNEEMCVIMFDIMQKDGITIQKFEQ